MRTPMGTDLRTLRARKLESLGTTLLQEGRARRGLRLLERAFELAREAGTPGDRSAGAIGETLARALEELGRSAELEERAGHFYAAGARGAATVRAVARRVLQSTRARQPADMEVLVTALEMKLLEGEARRAALRALSSGCHVGLRDHPERLQALRPLLERLQRLLPGLVFPRLYLGRLLYLRCDLKEAARWLAAVEGPKGRSPGVLSLRGRCAEKLGDLEEALRLYRASLKANEHQPHVHFRAARILLLQGLSARRNAGGRDA